MFFIEVVLAELKDMRATVVDDLEIAVACERTVRRNRSGGHGDARGPSLGGATPRVGPSSA